MKKFCKKCGIETDHYVTKNGRTVGCVPCTSLVGQRFERLLVLSRAGTNKSKRSTWNCKCDCGKETVTPGHDLTRGNTKSCGCLKTDAIAAVGRSNFGKNIVPLEGKRFGRLLVNGISHRNRHGQIFWDCLCNPAWDGCGKRTVVNGGCLKIGDTQSCGCLQQENLIMIQAPKPNGGAAKHQVFNVYQCGARIRGLVFSLSEEELISLCELPCNYCGAPPSNRETGHGGGEDFVYTGIDRIDNSKGYTLDNVVPCCYPCNRAKSNMYYEDFAAWIKRLVVNQIKKEVG